MCEPVSAGIAIASFAVGTTSAVMSYDAQKKAAKEARRANKQLQFDTANAADAEFNVGRQALTNRREQERAQAEQVLEQNTVTARRSALASTRAAAMADAQARVAAGAAGVSGASVTALLSDIERMDANNQAVISDDLTRAAENIRTNMRWSDEQRQAEFDALAVTKQNRINGVAVLPNVANPNPWVPALQIAQYGLQFGDYLNSRNPNTPKKQLPTATVSQANTPTNVNIRVG